MGWKSFRDHYGIGHIVTMDDGRVHIGSTHIEALIVVDQTGEVVKRPGGGGGSDLRRYVHDIEADRVKAAELIAAQDVFARAIPVYTWDRDEIVLEHCEKIGWPNVTHAGNLMHDNRYSPYREQAIEWMRRDAQSRLRNLQRIMAETERQLTLVRERLEDANAIAETVAREHPVVTEWPDEIDSEAA